MRKTALLLLLFYGLNIFVMPRPSIAEYDYDPSTKESPDPRAVAIKPTLLKLNEVVIAEVQKGIAALQVSDIATALNSFVSAINIEPYDPMAYILLIKTLISAGQEDLAYLWAERSGRNISDSNLIISNLYNFIKEAYPPAQEPQAPLISIAPFKDNKLCAVSFIFDDGEPSVGTDILPQFEKSGLRATVAINPGVTFEDKENIYRGNWDMWRKAKARGHEIANHGTNHKSLIGLSSQELQTEVVDSFNMIKTKLGEAPSTFIFPEDKTTPELVNYVEKLHPVSRDHQALSQVYNKLFIPVYGGKRFSIPTARLLIDLAMMRNLWLIPQCHGLYSPLIKKSFKAISPEMLEDQLKYLTENKEKIWVDTFIDVYKYLKERKETTLNVISSNDHEIVFSINNDLDKGFYSYPLTILINTTPSRPAKARAFDKETKKNIPVRTKDNTLLLDVEPSERLIHVRW